MELSKMIFFNIYNVEYATWQMGKVKDRHLSHDVLTSINMEWCSDLCQYKKRLCFRLYFQY